MADRAFVVGDTAQNDDKGCCTTERVERGFMVTWSDTVVFEFEIVAEGLNVHVRFALLQIYVERAMLNTVLLKHIFRHKIIKVIILYFRLRNRITTWPYSLLKGKCVYCWHIFTAYMVYVIKRILNSFLSILHLLNTLNKSDKLPGTAVFYQLQTNVSR